MATGEVTDAVNVTDVPESGFGVAVREVTVAGTIFWVKGGDVLPALGPAPLYVATMEWAPILSVDVVRVAKSG